MDLRQSGWMKLAAVAALWASAGCVADDPPEDAEPQPIEDWPHVICDDLTPEYCAFPFPSNVFTVADASTVTGRRVQLDEAAMPVNVYGNLTLPDPWNVLDGFSTGLAAAAFIPGATDAGLERSRVATSITIERSLEADSPTILLDTETGELVPHWVDLDATGRFEDQRTMLIRPAIRLADARRYIVAIRSIVDASGAPLPASPLFAALRDGDDESNPDVVARRELFDNIFAHLRKLDVERSSLQLAWDYTTASRENNTQWMVHMRDEALAAVGTEGPQYEITSVDTDWETDHIAYRIHGKMTVPMYLDKPEPGASLLIGADGMPEPDPANPWAEFPFEVLIPHSATQAPAGLIVYGHGLLGDRTQIESEHFRTFIDEYNYIIFGINFIGFAEDDEVPVGALIEAGEFHRWKNVIDRQHQGMLNQLLVMRMMKGRFSQDPMFGSFVDPSRAYYHGISQGGIFGGTYMALSTDVQRGALGVMGMPYSLLLTRSVDFDPFFMLIHGSYREDDRDVIVLLGLAQMLWDRTEPNGYLPYIRENTLTGTPPHEVLMRDALGDHQVTTLGAHVMARTLGVPIVDQGIREVFGLETVSAPHVGSGLVEYDFGLPPDPVGNLPQAECEDPHGKVRKLDEARKQLDKFLREGVIDVFCAGPCVFADMSGCG